MIKVIRTKPKIRVKLLTLKDRFLGGNTSFLSFLLFIVLIFITFCSYILERRKKKGQKKEKNKYVNEMLAP